MAEKMKRNLHDGSEEPLADSEANKYRRILAALQHPDCPVPMFDFDQRKLARHISIRMSRAYMRKDTEMECK